MSEAGGVYTISSIRVIIVEWKQARLVSKEGGGGGDPDDCLAANTRTTAETITPNFLGYIGIDVSAEWKQEATRSP